MRRHDDKQLIAGFLEATAELSTAEAGRLLGVSDETVARWRRGGWSRIHPATRRAVEDLIGRLQHAPSKDGEDAVTEMVVRFQGDGAIECLIRQIRPEELVAAAMRAAVVRGWDDHRRYDLTKLCYAILEEDVRFGPSSG